MNTKDEIYTPDMPRRLYTFFAGYSDQGAPSFSKFARSIGATLAEIKGFCQNEEFKRAYDECNEIRRDYLIDNALCKKFDGSFTKFLLTAELGMGESEGNTEDGFDFTLHVISTEKDKNEI
jgi:hypothetical protein